MALTLKQENFCLAYIESGDASKAYRKAYNAENMKPTTVNRHAKRLMDMDKIRARVEEFRAPVREAAGMTLEGHLDDLRALRDEAREMGQMGAAISAEVSRGKAAGYYVDRKELTGKDGAPLAVPDIVVKFTDAKAKTD